MGVFETFCLKTIYLTAACLVATEGRISISEDVTVYAGQSLTLSCRPRGSPANFVYWYKYAKTNDTVEHVRLHTGPSYTISMVTSRDAALYYCSGTEWGIWGISHHIMVNVIEPGKPSCTDGWSLHKHSCYLYYDRQLDTDWHRAAAYCRNLSGATLVKILDGSDVNFTRDLTKNRNELVFWLDVSPDTNGTLHWSDGSPVSKGWGARIRDNRNKWLDGMHNCTAFRRHDGRLKTFQCAKNLPFICQRDLPRPPSGVSIERITSSTARVVWNPSPNSNHGETETYFTECTTLSGMVVSRSSSVGSFTLLSNLRPNTEYKVRIQAGNSAGNGSSSSYVIFATKDKPPVIVTSTPSGMVIKGHTVSLRCGDSSQKIAWYKDDNYDKVISRDHFLNVVNATERDEGTYYCTANDGMRGSRNITVIEPPRITRLTAILLKHGIRGDNAIQTWLLCQTANRHPLEYSWTKDGAQLTSQEKHLQVFLKGEETFGKYECQVRNSAGTASSSIVISSLATTSTEPHSISSISLELLIIIGALSMVVLFCLLYTVQRNIAAWRKDQNRNRKFTTQDSSSETEAIQLEVVGPRDFSEVESPSGDFTRDNNDVFPYDVIQAWQETGQTGQTGQTYMSLLRRDNRPVEVAQAWKPDYTNISPSNRNDSAANCMYAPLRLTEGPQFAFNLKSRSYENMNASTSSKK